MVTPLRVVFMGTARFAVPSLERLHADGHQILTVVSQPDKPAGRGYGIQAPPVKAGAERLGLTTYQPASLRTPDVRQAFEALQMDLIVVVAYGKILPVWLLELPRLHAINLHGSILPRYRGAAPVNWAIVNGETETGVCTMQVEEGLDTGPVLMCERTAIGPDETAPQLSERLAIMGSAVLSETVRRAGLGTLEPKPQDASLATLAPILKKDDGNLDWTSPAQRIHDRVRGLLPWPAATARFRTGVVKVLKTRMAEFKETAAAAGTLKVSGGRLWACAGDGCWLEIVELQPENRKVMTGAAFANGARLEPAERFES